MRKTFSLILVVAAAGVFAGCPDKPGSGAAGAGSAEATTTTASAAPTAPATGDTTAASTAATAAPSGSAAAGAKTYDCGAKGQKPCPMQGWMKSVMGSASSSGDKDKLASAFAYVAGKPPPGMGNWTSIARDGEAKAKAGDIDGAKKTCETCHKAYKAKYKADMRDRPW
jgi:hypothetical protein